MAPSTSLPKNLLGVSTKMYFDLQTSKDYILGLSKLSVPPSCSLFLIPDFLSLSNASYVLQSSPHILIGAQDCHWEDSGAYTGEVSPQVLAQCGCRIVELGHAERRRSPYSESNEIIGMKALAAVRNDLIPLVCVGEKAKSEIMSEGVGLALRECLPQMTAILSKISPEAAVIFAYEPVWAIGASEPASADHVLAVVGALKKVVEQTGRTGEVRFLYGGSAGPGTWHSLKGGLDGLFLGRFAHDLGNLKKVLEEIGES